MSRETYYRVPIPKTYPFGRVCEAKDCTTRLSIYNQDHICAHCEETERLDKFEAEAQERREAELMQALLEEARG
jgi:hypothetical protein